MLDELMHTWRWFQLVHMLEVNALISGTPWSRTSRRLAGMFKRTVSRDRLNESVSDMGGSSKKAASSSSSSVSVFGRSSSSLGDSHGVEMDELGRPFNWSGRLSSSVRRLMGAPASDTSPTRDRPHSKAMSDSRLATMGQHANFGAAFSRSHSSNALSASISGGVDRDSRAPSAFEDAAAGGGGATEGEGSPEGAARSKLSFQAPSSPRWSRGVSVSPSDRGESGTDGRIDEDTAT